MARIEWDCKDCNTWAIARTNVYYDHTCPYCRKPMVPRRPPKESQG